MVRLARMLFWVLALAFVAEPAIAAKRVALIIGNGAYVNATQLSNPARDAAAIEALFKAAGFDVVQRLSNLGAVAMRRALRDFSDQARGADIAVVFYAGHGIEVNGANYLLPVDTLLERDIDVEDETISLDRVSQVIEPAKQLRLIILDACRDNPFIRSMKRTGASRSIGRGLAKIEVLTSNTLIAYAAKAGSTAADGDGTNSPYTAALVKHLATPGLDVRLAFGRVRDAVVRTTANRQEPFVYGSLGGSEIALVAEQRGRREWQDVKHTTSITVLEKFIARYKNDAVYAGLAQERLDALKREEQARLAKQEAERKARDEAAAAANRKSAPATSAKAEPQRSSAEGAKQKVGAETKAEPKTKSAKRPDPSVYSLRVWPAGSIPTGQVRSTSTELGLLTCVGGSNPTQKRDCRWQ